MTIILKWEKTQQTTLINDISVTLQKKKKLKQMQDNPTDFVTDVQGDYDPT